MGYNGLPNGCSDDEYPWAREGDDPLETKYVYAVHSELNAILNYGGGSLKGAKIDPDTLMPVEYYCKLPSDCDKREVFVVDPMLATGGSSSEALAMLKQKGVKNMTFLCILAAPEGLEKLSKDRSPS